MKNRKLSERILDFLRWTDDPITYLHRTGSESCARAILEEGFQFHLWSTTTDPSSKEDKNIERWHLARTESKGLYTVKFGFRRALFEKYSELAKTYRIPGGIRRDMMFQLLCDKKVKNYPHEMNVLPVQFVAGYCIASQDLIVPNPDYQPDYKYPQLERKVKEFSEKIHKPLVGPDGIPRPGWFK